MKGEHPHKVGSILSPDIRAKLRRMIEHFDLVELLDVLEYYGIVFDQITFRSHPGSESQPRLVKDIDFNPDGTVSITLYLGLSSANSPLPTYFMEMVDRGLIQENHFRDLIGFIDAVILKDWARSLRPEKYYICYDQNLWLKASGNLSSLATIQHLSSFVVPELKVRVSRYEQQLGQVVQPAVLGHSKIGIEMILGNRFYTIHHCLRIEFISDNERSSSGRFWNSVIIERLKQLFFPIYEGFDLFFEFWLVICLSEQWLTIGSDAATLGYERFKGRESKHKKVLLYSGTI